MATSEARISDSISVELTTGEVKGPAKDRLANHANEARRFKESPDTPKGPASNRDSS